MQSHTADSPKSIVGHTHDEQTQKRFFYCHLCLVMQVPTLMVFALLETIHQIHRHRMPLCQLKYAICKKIEFQSTYHYQYIKEYN